MNPAFEVTATVPAPLADLQNAGARIGLAEWVGRLLGCVRVVPHHAADRSTGLYNRPGLLAAADAAVNAQVNASQASMILLEFADLREVYEIYGTSIARKLLERIVRRLHRVAGAGGLVGRTGPWQFCVVLPGTSHQKALARLQSGFGKPARVEFDAGDSEIVLVPSLLVDSAEPGEHAMQGLYRQMCRELARILNDEHRRLNYLASERERHSRPMGVAAHT